MASGTPVSELERAYQRGFAHGYQTCISQYGDWDMTADEAYDRGKELAPQMRSDRPRRKKAKRKKSKKMQILDNLAAKAWKKYKKGSGKKTYIEIRAQVSRSRDYKKKVKNL